MSAYTAEGRVPGGARGTTTGYGDNGARVTLRRDIGRIALVAALIVAPGCESVLEVDLPGSIPAENLDNPELAETLVNSVIADFECAYNNFTFGAAVHSDEMWHSSGNLVQRLWGQRRITSTFDNYINGSCSGAGYGMWVPLHAARFQAEDIYERLTGFPDEAVPEKTSKLATVAAIAGYTYVILGETFCEMTIDGGAPMQPAEVLAIAEDWFDNAIQLATQSGNEEMLNLATLGRARVRLDLGRYADARADAEQIPDGFRYLATRSADLERRFNKGVTEFVEEGHHTIAPGFRNLEWKGVPDPRVEVEFTGEKGFDAVTDLWIATKYTTRDAPIEVATWEEAQLIIAEAAANTGDAATAVSIIDELHMRAGLPGYDPATDGPVMEHIIQERSRELFMEGGHRLNDMLRFGLPFFSGIDHIGQPYGNTTCFPLPAIEGGS